MINYFYLNHNFNLISSAFYYEYLINDDSIIIILKKKNNFIENFFNIDNNFKIILDNSKTWKEIDNKKYPQKYFYKALKNILDKDIFFVSKYYQIIKS